MKRDYTTHRNDYTTYKVKGGTWELRRYMTFTPDLVFEDNKDDAEISSACIMGQRVEDTFKMSINAKDIKNSEFFDHISMMECLLRIVAAGIPEPPPQAINDYLETLAQSVRNGAADDANLDMTEVDR